MKLAYHLLLLSVCTCWKGTSGLREEFNLLKELLNNYDTAARPVLNLSEVVEVRMGIALFQIRELNEKSQYLTVNAWFQFHWRDPHLIWNTSSYGGLNRIRIPSSRLWVPDVVLYNSVDETKPATQIFPETNAIVSSSGEVLWVIPAMIKSSCKIDITYFPFDQQRCPLKFGSWTYDGFQLDLVNLKETGDLTKFIENGEWLMIGMPAQRNVEYYSCCDEPYVDVTYSIVIRRRPMFFTYNLVFPCLLLMGIGIMVFCLPPESGEKVSLGVTVLLAMTVYQLLIADAIPPTSEVVPLIGQFFGATIFLLSLSTFMTVVIMKLHFSGEHGNKVPRWLRKTVLVCLARMVRMSKTAKMAYQRRDRLDENECLQVNFSNADARDYGVDASAGGDVTLLSSHPILRDESSLSISFDELTQRRTRHGGPQRNHSNGRHDNHSRSENYHHDNYGRSECSHHDNRGRSEGGHHDNRGRSEGGHHDNRGRSEGGHHDNRSRSESGRHDNPGRSDSSRHDNHGRLDGSALRRSSSNYRQTHEATLHSGCTTRVQSSFATTSFALQQPQRIGGDNLPMCSNCRPYNNYSPELPELLSHVRQMNKEIHNRHSSRDADEHYKSEWRMVALVLDRILLIIFFVITLFTTVIIFANVPP